MGDMTIRSFSQFCARASGSVDGVALPSQGSLAAELKALLHPEEGQNINEVYRFPSRTKPWKCK